MGYFVLLLHYYSPILLPNAHHLFAILFAKTRPYRYVSHFRASTYFSSGGAARTQSWSALLFVQLRDHLQSFVNTWSNTLTGPMAEKADIHVLEDEPVKDHHQQELQSDPETQPLQLKKTMDSKTMMYDKGMATSGYQGSTCVRVILILLSLTIGLMVMALLLWSIILTQFPHTVCPAQTSATTDHPDTTPTLCPVCQTPEDLCPSTTTELEPSTKERKNTCYDTVTVNRPSITWTLCIPPCPPCPHHFYS